MKNDSLEGLKNNYLKLKNTLPEEVKLIAVSKTFPAELVEALYELGHRDFGENKVQELSLKSQKLKHLADIRWHFIGHLQSNKVNELLKVPNLDMIHSVDREKVAEKLNSRLIEQGRSMPILIQVNTSKEESKYGCLTDKAISFATQVDQLQCLEVKGFMTLGKLGGSEEENRHCFKILHQTSKEFEKQTSPKGERAILSMGMTSDWKIAISEGSTCVRIGQAIFGKRSLPDSFYWPSHIK